MVHLNRIQQMQYIHCLKSLEYYMSYPYLDSASPNLSSGPVSTICLPEATYEVALTRLQGTRLRIRTAGVAIPFRVRGPEPTAEWAALGAVGPPQGGESN